MPFNVRDRGFAWFGFERARLQPRRKTNRVVALATEGSRLSLVPKMPNSREHEKLVRPSSGQLDFDKCTRRGAHNPRYPVFGGPKNLFAISSRNRIPSWHARKIRL